MCCEAYAECGVPWCCKLLRRPQHLSYAKDCNCQVMKFRHTTIPAVQIHAGPVGDTAVIKLESACCNKPNEVLLDLITAKPCCRWRQ